MYPVCWVTFILFNLFCFFFFILFRSISILYGLFNAEICFLWKCSSIIINISFWFCVVWLIVERYTNFLRFFLLLSFDWFVNVTQSAGAGEYTDCTSTESQDSPPNECPVYDTKQSDGNVPVMLGLWGMRGTLHSHCSHVHSGPVGYLLIEPYLWVK